MNFRDLTFALFGALICLPGAWSQTLDGETFTKKFVSGPPNGDQLVEFVRADESFEQWTRLIGYRLQHAPQIDNDPGKMVSAMAGILLKKSPDTSPLARVKKETGDALIDFITWPADGRYVELNVIRFFKNAAGDGMVSLQFAHRVPKAELSETKGKELAEIRSRWTQQVMASTQQEIERMLIEQSAGQ